MALLNWARGLRKRVLHDIDGALVNFPEALKQSPASVVFFYRGQWWPWCRVQVTAFVCEYERYRENNVAIFGISPQAAEHGRQLRERIIRDAQIDHAAHKDHESFWRDPKSAFPFRLIGDPENSLAARVGAVREAHWSGPMVHATTYLVDSDAIIRWRFQSKMAQRRPSPTMLAEMAAAVAKKQPVPEYKET